MYRGKIINHKNDKSGMQVLIRLEDTAPVKKRQGVTLYLDEDREITGQQRKKIYATLNDIAIFTGYSPVEAKQIMKYEHIKRTGCDYFSLSDCSIDTAREFINTLVEFCLHNGVPVKEPMLSRTDDIDTYLYQCLRHRKCCICGRDGEVHHWDTVGMGNDRRTYDDRCNRKMCLCRVHHTIAHQKGGADFQEKYHVYGIIYNESE